MAVNTVAAAPVTLLEFAVAVTPVVEETALIATATWVALAVLRPPPIPAEDAPTCWPFRVRSPATNAAVTDVPTLVAVEVVPAEPNAAIRALPIELIAIWSLAVPPAPT